MTFFQHNAPSALRPNIKPNKKELSTATIRKLRDKDKPLSVTIRNRGVSIHIGNYSKEIDAQEAIDRAMLVLDGEHAVLNFPDKEQDITGMRLHIERTVRAKGFSPSYR